MTNNGKGGPKTTFGKRRSSQNARRHGLFSAAFSLSAAEAAEYEKLSSDFQKELKPDNSFLDALFQDVVASFWNLQIAHGYKQQELQKLFTAENAESDEKPQGVGECFPYGVKAWQRGQVIKLLDYLRDQVETRRVLPPDLEEPVTQACGADFWKALAEWTPFSSKRTTVCLLAAATYEKFEKLDNDDNEKYFVADGIKETEMIWKIIAIYNKLLINDPRPVESRDGMLLDKRVSRLDLALRYVTMARRDFYRALEEYWKAKNAG